MAGVAGTWGIKTGVTVSVGVNELAMLDDGDGCGGNAGLLEDLRGDAIDTNAESRIDDVDGQIGRSGRDSGRKEYDKIARLMNLENCLDIYRPSLLVQRVQHFESVSQWLD